jgi:hypothetical protein
MMMMTVSMVTSHGFVVSAGSLDGDPGGARTSVSLLHAAGLAADTRE